MNAYDLHHYGRKIETIFNKYNAQLEQRFSDEIPFDTFINADPSDNKIYLEWIVDSFIFGGILRLEDISARVRPALEDYIYLKQSNQLKQGENPWENEKDISKFCGLVGCKKKNFEKPGLEKLLNKYEKVLEHRQIKIAQSEQIKKDTDVVFENASFTILSPKTQEASCYYGQGTKWCTAATRGENMFDEYAQSGDIYIMIPKRPQHVGEKYQFHFEDEQFMDESDEKVFILKGQETELFKPLITMYPSLNDWDRIKNFKYTSLSLTNLKLNELPELPEGLIDLDCSTNKLLHLSNLPSTLEILDCSVNRITEIPVVPQTLKEFNCAENKITEFPKNISECIELETIIMNNNKIQTIPNNLPDSVKTILIFNNDLREIPDVLPKSLIELNVTNNFKLIPSVRLDRNVRIYY